MQYSCVLCIKISLMIPLRDSMTSIRPYAVFSMLDDYRICLFDDTEIALWLPNLLFQVFAIIFDLIMCILTWDFSHRFLPLSNFGSHHEDFWEIARSTQVRKSSPFGRKIFSISDICKKFSYLQKFIGNFSIKIGKKHCYKYT